MKKENIVINNAAYCLKIYYENRADSRVSISRTTINIRLPRALSREEQFRELLKLKAWAQERILQKPERYKKRQPRQYKDGEVIEVGAECYTLAIRFKEKQSSSAMIKNDTIELTISSTLSTEQQQKHISTLISRLIGRKRIKYLKEKIQTINEKHFQETICKIFFKNNKSNWGSCSKDGNINISTRLLFAPDDVLEYVCTHELAHKKVFNHTEMFWSLVEKAMPNYKEKEQWLKENGDKCFF